MNCDFPLQQALGADMLNIWVNLEIFGGDTNFTPDYIYQDIVQLQHPRNWACKRLILVAEYRWDQFYSWWPKPDSTQRKELIGWKSLSYFSTPRQKRESDSQHACTS
jgi:hypothetical protein